MEPGQDGRTNRKAT